MEHVTNAHQTLEIQLATIENKILQLPVQQKLVEELQGIAKQIEHAGVTYNPHSTLSCKDILMQWEQYQEFLTQKRLATEEEITITKHRGVTADQIKEIERSFRMFDTNKDGYIDKKELKKCLYSLGEEREMREIERIIEDYSDNSDPPKQGQIGLARFQEFMVKIYGDTGAKDEIVASLALLAKDDNVMKEENMDIITRVMNPQDLEYITTNTPKEEPPGNGYIYKAWVDEMFSR